DPRVRRDPYWPQLAAHLAKVARTDIDLSQLIDDAASDGPLPDLMPGAALWWRLAGRVQPATLEASTPYLQPKWLGDLSVVFGTAIAETIIADPAFGRLVAAVDNADPLRWNPIDLLHVAHDHLRDVDSEHTTPIRPDEYALLLTYSIDLFATANPYDHIDIPVPHEEPISVEEHEELAHRFPDPERPLEHPDTHAGLSDDALLEKLGLGYGGSLIPPDLGDDTPPDPFEYDGYAGEDPLAFEDLLTERPLTRPVADVLANVIELRGRYHAAVEQLKRLRRAVMSDQGPAMTAAQDTLRDLRARADADRPYMLAVQEVMARWADAEQHYDSIMAMVAHERAQLSQLQADPTSDESAVDFARSAVALAVSLLPEQTPAEQFQADLTEALTRRAEAAGGADRIVTAEDVDAERRRAMTHDSDAVTAARIERDRLAGELNRAESATAIAFAEAETRNAAHVLDNVAALHTEMDMLRSAGAYVVERGFTVPATAGETLS
ncbi:MAG: hypothetical protein HY239_17355, partial [Mycolicibacterium aromaticivorans]|nr:hypothetical protein [Mycolicibacterium aromaticivorans]